MINLKMVGLQPDVTVMRKVVARDWTGKAAEMAINYSRSVNLLDRIDLECVYSYLLSCVNSLSQRCRKQIESAGARFPARSA